MSYWQKTLIVVGVVIAIFLIWIAFSPTGRATFNRYVTTMKQVDDSSMYAQRKLVEDTCRAMRSGYLADKNTYEQYIGSALEEPRNWAVQAKLRANKTAFNYNEYILKNSFVWEGNVPKDIDSQLEIIK